MKSILIAVKQGVTLYGGGTILAVEDHILTKEVNGEQKKYYQISDDGMGRPTLIETKDAIVCSEDQLLNAQVSHARCNFSKEEVIGSKSKRYEGDFSVRSISFEKKNDDWFLIWRPSKKDQSVKTAEFINKVTKEVIYLEAANEILEYEVFSISPVDYEQTSRKFKALHQLWNLKSIPPGFYEANINLGNDFKGRVHFIKHFPVQLTAQDERKTEEVLEITFSEELWNSALDISLAWGPESRIPFHVRLLDLYPEVKWAEANFLEKICNEASSFAWRVYEKEAAGTISIQQAMAEVAESYPWIDPQRQSRLRTLGEYYSKLKG